MTDYNYLLAYATDAEKPYLDAIIAATSLRDAAKQLGNINHQKLSRLLSKLKQTAALKGNAPDNNLTHAVPDPFIVKGYSTYYGQEGEVKGQWVKTKIDDVKRLESIQLAINEFILYAPKITAIDKPKGVLDDDIIPWLQIGDAHLGMLAHAGEVTDNFDLKIAEIELCAAISELIDDLPNCKRLVINDLGDFTHAENIKAETEASGHKLDVDGRFTKMISVYSRVMRFIIEKCLSKAEVVDVIINQGNHSRTNDIWMSELLRVAYGHTGRVNVLNNGNVFIAYRMGNTLVMTHHSDKCKPKRLVDVMTSDYRRDFGETCHHYIDIGHVHHNMVLAEHPSVIIESFNNLAPNDKWAHDAGYRSRKTITIIYRSK